MALKVVTMTQMRLEVLLEVERTGMSVAEVCRRYGISRQTYYRYRRRYLAEGLKGLEDRSRRPLEPANHIAVEINNSGRITNLSECARYQHLWCS